MDVSTQWLLRKDFLDAIFMFSFWLLVKKNVFSVNVSVTILSACTSFLCELHNTPAATRVLICLYIYFILIGFQLVVHYHLNRDFVIFN